MSLSRPCLCLVLLAAHLVYPRGWREQRPNQPSLIKDRSLITGRGGGTKWINRRSKILAPPSLKTGLNVFTPPIFKGWQLLVPPSSMVKTQAPVLKIPQNLLCPPLSGWLKLFPTPLFVGVKLHLPPHHPPIFAAPPPPHN